MTLSRQEKENLLIQLAESKTSLDETVWSVFQEYLSLTGSYFSDPEGWSYDPDGDCITVYGTDGARGQYENRTLDIPVFLILNPKEEFEKLRKEAEERQRQREEAKLAEQRRQYERLGRILRGK